VNSSYVLVYCHTNVKSENIPPVAWLRKCYGIFSRSYKKNLKQLYVVHPSSLVKATMHLFKPFTSSKFWAKVKYVKEIREMFDYMSPQQVQLPPEVTSHVVKGNNSKQQIFGVPLHVVMAHPMNHNLAMPKLVMRAIDYLQRHGYVEGIFRLSGRVHRIDEIKKAYNRGEDLDFSNEMDPHVVAGLLKSYIRELPDPLCTYNLHNKWIQTYAPHDIPGSVARMRVLLIQLPAPNLTVLKALMGLLVALSKADQDTKMTASNLAICWAPNILRSPDTSPAQALMETPILNSLTSLLVTYYCDIFISVGPEDSQPQIKRNGSVSRKEPSSSK